MQSPSKKLLRASTLVAFLLLPLLNVQAGQGHLVYLVSDLRIPFWQIMWRGVEQQARARGYQIEVRSAQNQTKRELEFTAQAIRDQVDGIVLSPVNSSSAATVLALAERAGIPVVISDIGTEEGEYVSYIASDNFDGSYRLGQILAAAMRRKGWDSASVGIIAIPQQRANGKARTAGFLQALKEAGIKGGGIRQQIDFSYRETYDFARDLLLSDPGMRALWLQGSNRYQGALDAIRDSGRSNEVLLICFDAEPEFLDLIPAGTLVGSGMQQPFLMGEKSAENLIAHLEGHKVAKHELLPVLAISTTNIANRLTEIHRNVLGLKAD